MDFTSSEKEKKFNGQTILAIDFGTKVTGLALYTPGREPYPLPFGKIVVKDDKQVISEILQDIDDEFVEILVFGVPYLTDGQATDQTKMTQKFGQKLKSQLPPSVTFFEQDETLSTFEAEDRMKNSPRYNFKVNLKEIDALAASIILEDFLKN